MWTTIDKNYYGQFLDNTKLQYELNSNDNINDIILHKTETHYMLPRLFYNNYNNKIKRQILNNVVNPNVNFKTLTSMYKKIKFVGKLREDQNKIIHQLQSCFKNNNKKINGIIQARPGIGKTIISIYLAILLNKRPLIIVDNTKLLEQWTEEILKFTNIKKENIGIIKGSKLEIDDDKYFCIAMIQTLVSKVKRQLREFYDKFHKAGFNIVYFDECHKSSAGPKYAKASLLLDTENIIGLSATPFVKNMHKILLYNTIGKIIVKNAKYDIKPDIYFILYDSKLDKSKYAKQIKYMLYNDYILGRSKYNSFLHNSQEYLRVITRLYLKLKDTEYTKIMSVCFTINQVNAIHKHLKKNNIQSKEFYSKKKKINKEIDNNLIATYQYASHGFNYKALQVIILTCPLSGKTSLTQVIGRGLRSYPNKNNALIFILIDIGFDGEFTNKIPQIKNILKNEFGNCNMREIAV
jgi:superfamily II DNA or RNA helicase